MSNSGGRIYAPVSIADVKKVLGVADNNIGALCKSSRINKWAKYKPVVYASLFERDREKLGSGIEVNNIKSTPQTIALAAAGTYVWKYIRPNGGTSQPYRQTDFVLYDHYAECPIEYQFFEQFQDILVTSSVWVFMNRMTSASDGTYMDLEDVFNINTYKNYRLTLAVVEEDSSGNPTKVLRYYFSEFTLGEYQANNNLNEMRVYITAMRKYAQYNKTYRGVIFLTDYNFEDFSDVKEGVSAITGTGLSLETETGAHIFHFKYAQDGWGDGSGNEITIQKCKYKWYNLSLSFEYNKNNKILYWQAGSIIIDLEWEAFSGLNDIAYRVMLKIDTWHFPYDEYSTDGYLSTPVESGTYIMSDWKSYSQLNSSFDYSKPGVGSIVFNDFAYSIDANGKKLSCPFFIDATEPSINMTVIIQYKSTIQPDSEAKILLGHVAHINNSRGDYFFDGESGEITQS